MASKKKKTSSDLGGSSDPKGMPPDPANPSPEPAKSLETPAESSGQAAEPSPANASEKRAEKTDAEKQTKPKMSRGRKWRRRFVFAGIAVLLLMVILRVVVIFALPSVLAKVSARYGFSAKYERLELNVLGGDVGIWHFSLAPAGGGDDLFRSEYMRCDISPMDLLHGRLVVRRIDAEGVSLLVERKEDGTIPLLAKFTSATGNGPTPTPAAPGKSAATQPGIDLTSPLEIDVFRLSNVHAHIRDEAVTPHVDTQIDLNIRLTDLASEGHATRLEMDMSANPLLDLLRVEGTGTAAGKELKADLRVELRGVHPGPLAGYLQPLGIRPVAQGISVQMDAHIRTSAAARPDALAADILLENISATADGLPSASLSKLAIVADTINFNVAHVNKVEVTGARGHAMRTAGGVLRIVGLEFMPLPPSAAPPVAPAKVAAPPPFTPLIWSLDQFTLTDAAATFDDLAISPAAQLGIAVDRFSVGSISADHLDAPIPFSGELSAPGIAAAIHVSGQVSPLAQKKLLAAHVAAEGIRPDALRPYLTQMGVESEYENGKFTCDVKGSVGIEGGAITADATIEKVSLTDKTDLLTLDSLAIGGAKINLAENMVSVDSILASGPGISGRLEPAGTLAALGLHVHRRSAGEIAAGSARGGAAVSPLATPTTVAAGNIAPANTAAATQPSNWVEMIPKVHLGKLSWTNVRVRFEDQTVSPATSLALSDAGVEMNNLNLDLSGGNSPPSPGTIRAWMAAPNLAGNIMVAGTIDPRPLGPSVDLSIDGTGITTKQIAPYFRNTLIEPILADGTIHLKTKLALIREGNSLSATASLSNMTYKDGEGELVGVDSADLAASMSGNELTIRNLALKSPRISVEREADGSFVVAGVRVRLPAKVDAPPSALAASIASAGKLPAGGENAGRNERANGLGARNSMRQRVELDINPTTTRPEVSGLPATIPARDVAGAIPATNPSVATNPAMTADATTLPDASTQGSAALASGSTNPSTMGATPTTLASATSLPAVAASAPSTEPALPPALVAILQQLNVQDASVQWIDRAVTPNVTAHLIVSSDVSGLIYGKPSDPAKFSVQLHEDSAVDQMNISGTLTSSPTAPAAHLVIDGSGLRAGKFTAYIPPGIDVTLRDGRFKATIDAAVSPNAAGGNGIQLSVSGLEYRDGPEGDPLLKLDAMRLAASRIDPVGSRIAIEEISVSGVAGGANRSADGAIHAMGVRVGGPRAAGAAGAMTAPSVVVVETQTTKPSAVVVAAPAAAQTDASALSTAQLASIASKHYPYITIDKLDLGLVKFDFTDGARPGTAPISLADLRLVNAKKIELLGREPASLPPIELEISGAVHPLVDSVSVKASLKPFVDEAGLNVDVQLAGIHGDGLLNQAPQLKEQMDASGLTDGRLTMHLAATMTRSRTDPLEFDLSKDFKAGFSVKQLEFRNGADGPLLAGVEEITSEDIAVRPSSSTVIVKSLEITKPAAKVLRDAAGLHILDVVIKLPPGLPGEAVATQGGGTTVVVTHAATRPGEAVAPVTVTVNTSTPAAQSTASPTQPAAAPVGEIRIDQILVSGLDFSVEDRTCDPAFIMPLTSMDVDVRGLTSRLPYEDKSVRFSVLVNAGKVPLPVQSRTNAASSAIGAANKPARVATTLPRMAGMEQRDLFAQVEMSGVLSIYQFKPKGWIKASVSGFDMASLEGEAKQLNETLTAGTLDTAIDLRFAGDGSMDTHSHTTITDLSLSEPSKGFFERNFKLPTPLNIGLAAVEDADGSVNIPGNFTVVDGKLSSTEITNAAVTAVGSVFVTAIASTPLKAVNVVSDIIPLPLFGDKKEPPKPVTVDFGPAQTGIDAGVLADFQLLLQQMKDNQQLELTLRHDLGASDLPVAQTLANPTPAQCADLAYSLRQQKMDLLATLATVKAQARAQLASGYGTDADQTIGKVHELERQLAAVEDGLDYVYSLLKPGAEKQADRRTRAACLEIGNERLQNIQRMLVNAGVDPGRIKVTHASYNVAEGMHAGSVTVTPTITKQEK